LAGLAIVVALVAIVGILALLFMGPVVSRVYYHAPISSDPDCDPTVAEIGPVPPPPGACIRTVVPERQEDSAIVVIDVVPDLPPCIEGCSAWAQARSLDEGVVLQQRLATSTTSVFLPPGRLVVSVHIWSPCVGDCEEGVSTMFDCSYEITAVPHETINLDFPWREGRRCPAAAPTSQ
jgi:hypothetical protein